MLGRDGLVELADVECHLVDLAQQIVRELEVGLVDLVDQQHDGLLVGREGLAEHAELDVLADDLAHVVVTEPRCR